MGKKSQKKLQTGRIKVMGIIFTVLIMLILFRAFTFQVWKREPWNSMAPKQHQHRVKLVANRGTIFDRHMNILAMDLPITTLALDPIHLNEKEEAAQLLSEVVGGEKEHYLQLIEKNKDKSFVRLNVTANTEQRIALEEKRIHGIILLNERERTHPYGTLCQQVIGITNREHQGVGGIEQAFDAQLKGEHGWAINQRDALNRSFVSPDYPAKPSMDGQNLILTIDQPFQTILEEELKAGVIDHRAKAGSAILMDPFTGEILAMTSMLGPTNTKENQLVEHLQNRSVQVDFEPGSTFKIVAAAAAIEEKIFDWNSLIHCENGVYRLANHDIHDHNKAYAWLTVKQIMEVSSNIGMAKIGRKLGKKLFYRYIRDFGFGNRTGIGLPGEVAGILRPIYQWSDISTATISFGQEISATAIQMACMASVIANGGELMKPRIVRAVRDQNDLVVKTYQREVIRRVISETTASRLTEMLEGVIRDGNGDKAAVEGIRIAGKTGTAQKSIPGHAGYFPGAYVSSFIGFWPAESPMYVLVVVLDEAQDMYWGATSAAPVFAKVVSRVIGLPRPNRSPLVITQSLPVSENQFEFSSLEIEDNAPAEQTDKIDPVTSPYHIPRLTGMSVREALQKLAAIGVTAEIEGSGVIIEQIPRPNRKIEEGMVCKLICQYPHDQREGN